MKLIIAYRVLVALGVVLFLIGLVNLALDYQLGSFQLLSVLLATGGIVVTGFASIMVDHCKIRAKTAFMALNEMVHERTMDFGNNEEAGMSDYKPNLLPMDWVFNEEAFPKSFPSGFISPDWYQVLSDYTINPAVAQTNEEKDQQHLAHLIRKGTKGFTE